MTFVPLGSRRASHKPRAICREPPLSSLRCIQMQMTLDRLVNLCFQRARVICIWMQRSEESGGSRQIALGLCDARLERNGTNVIVCDVKNLIKLPQRFGEATEPHIGKGVLGEEISVAHIEPLSFVEV